MLFQKGIDHIVHGQNNTTGSMAGRRELYVPNYNLRSDAATFVHCPWTWICEQYVQGRWKLGGPEEIFVPMPDLDAEPVPSNDFPLLSAPSDFLTSSKTLDLNLWTVFSGLVETRGSGGNFRSHVLPDLDAEPVPSNDFPLLIAPSDF